MPLITSFKSHVGTTKGQPPRGTPVEVADLAALREHILRHPSPEKRANFTVTAFEGGFREDARVTSYSGFVAIDLEGPRDEPLDADDLQAIFDILNAHGYAYVRYHTHSHLAPSKGARARVVLQASPAPTSNDEYRALVKSVWALLPEGCYDTSCINPSRAFFYPPEEHPPIHRPGRVFVWDPQTALTTYAPRSRPRPFEPPDSFQGDPDVLEAFLDAFSEILDLSPGNRNEPSLWLLGALRSFGLSEDESAAAYDRCFADYPEHLDQRDARVHSTYAKDPSELKIWGHIAHADPFPNPRSSLGLFDYLGVIRAEPFKQALQPPPPPPKPQPVLHLTPFPAPHTHTHLSPAPAPDPKGIIEGFLNEYFGGSGPDSTLRIHQNLFYYYDGQTWQRDDANQTEALLNHYVEHAEAYVQSKNGSYLKSIYSAKAAAQRREVIQQLCRTSAQSDVVLPTNAAIEDPNYLCLQNGIFHVPTQTLLDPSPKYRTVGRLPARYLGAETPPTPQLDAFLKSCDFDEDQCLAWFDAAAYLLFGRAEEYQKMVLLVGPPRAGKGVTTRLIETLVGGPEVCATVNVSDFGGQFSLMNTIGRKLLVVNDADFHYRWGNSTAAKLKCISAGEPVTIDRKHLQPWTGKLGKILVASNQPPTSADADWALINRWYVVQFRRSHLQAEDPTILGRLLGELDAIFTRLVHHWQDVQRRGKLHQTADVQEFRRETALSTDPVADFLDSETTTDPDHEQPRTELWNAFSQWQDEVGIPNAARIRRSEFYLQLRTIGFRTKQRSDGKRVFLGLKLV